MKNKILKKNREKGFVMLYTMILSSIILAISIGILNVALKETNFSISARAANEAFFAADTGAECALYYDRINNNAFSGTLDSMQCGLQNQNIQLNPIGDGFWSFVVPNLGESERSCAKVTLTRDPSNFSTTIISKGYNNANPDSSECNPASNSVERELEVTY